MIEFYEELIEELEDYKQVLIDLVNLFEKEGKSSKVIILAQRLSNMDIGLICWNISEYLQQLDDKQLESLKSILQNIYHNSLKLQNLVKDERGLPTLTMLSKSILFAVDNILLKFMK